MNTYNRTIVHPLEKFLVILGEAVCVVVTIVIWRSVSAYQGMWPLPGGYFIEMAALSIIGALAFVRGGASGRIILWAMVGIFAAFSIMGAFSVGILFVPVILLFAAAAVSSDLRNKGPIVLHLVVCLIAGLAQAASMFAVIRLLYPSVGF